LAKSSYDTIPDAELLAKYYSTQNTDWLGILLQRYTVLLYGVGIKYFKDEAAAKDMVQTVFYKVLQEMHKHQVTYFKSWLYTIAKNCCLMELRKKGLTTTALPDDTAVAAENTNAEEHLTKERNLTFMEEAIEELNQAQKQCITLFYLYKKSYQEIVAITNYDLLQVKSHIQNGKRNLKITIERLQKNAR
jgi:RNA polymerase sigma factor (sigma-70 family)